MRAGILALLIGTAGFLLWQGPAAPDGVPAALPAERAETPPVPARVVSMNLCTDQLALLLAAPGQLVSVSHLAADPRASALAGAAAALPANRGLAEQIFLMRPDLVLAGSFSNPATVDLLRRLGVRVESFAPETGMEDIRAAIARMGALLGRQAEAAAMLARFDADLARLAAGAPARRPRAALYDANGWTSGDASLAGQILRLAGFDNVAEAAGLHRGGTLPLERLVMADPDLVVSAARRPAASRAEEVLDHPALAALAPGRHVTTGADWVCGTPFVLRAAADLAARRPALGLGG
nr:ABC transporter substrate-binding protein [Frigidibacter oleivorans]